MSDEKNHGPSDPAVELQASDVDPDQAVREAQFLVAYAAEAGLEIDRETIRTLVNSKYVSQQETWTPETEVAFWNAVNAMAAAVKPVTLSSLRAIRPPVRRGSRKRASLADRAVFRYRVLAVGSLVLLLLVQIYWLAGATAIRNFDALFQQEAELKDRIREIGSIGGASSDRAGDPQVLEHLNDELHQIEHRRDANFEIIESWNRVWLTLLLRRAFTGKLHPNRKIEYEARIRQLTAEIEMSESRLSELTEDMRAEESRQIEAKREKLEEFNLDRESDISSNELFLNELSAMFVLRTLQIYFLPLLYGLLGSVLFVLRTLSKDIRLMIYSREAEINYRLRMSMGAVAGLAVGWFMTTETRGGAEAFSPFALSFLVGYHVEVLFSLMDRLISGLTKKGAPTGAEAPSKGAGSS